MKKNFVVIAPILISIVISIGAFADTIKESAVVSTAPYNWTGFYVGLNAGAVNHTMNITDTNATTFLGTIQQVSNPALAGGLQAGYRRQVALSSLAGVYGLEISANFSNANFSKSYGSPSALYQLNSTNSLDSICLFELTGGIAADKTLLFLAGGLSWVNISGGTNNVSGAPFFNSFSVSKGEFGTALSAGIEYAFTDKLSARFKVDVVSPNTYTTFDNVGDSFTVANTIVQGTFGINYKFA